MATMSPTRGIKCCPAAILFPAAAQGIASLGMLSNLPYTLTLQRPFLRGSLIAEEMRKIGEPTLVLSPKSDKIQNYQLEKQDFDNIEYFAFDVTNKEIAEFSVSSFLWLLFEFETSQQSSKCQIRHR